MRNGACVTWLVGWPIIADVDKFVNHLVGDKPVEVTLSFAVVWVSIWIGVAIWLHDRRSATVGKG